MICRSCSHIRRTPSPRGWRRSPRATVLRSTRTGRGSLGDDTVLVRTIVVDGAVVGNIGSFVVEGERAVGY